MTDVPGVKDKKGSYISKLTILEAQKLIDNQTITGGMIPKIQTCISAVKNGVGGVVIIDGLDHMLYYMSYLQTKEPVH